MGSKRKSARKPVSFFQGLPHEWSSVLKIEGKRLLIFFYHVVGFVAEGNLVTCRVVILLLNDWRNDFRVIFACLTKRKFSVWGTTLDQMKNDAGP